MNACAQESLGMKRSLDADESLIRRAQTEFGMRRNRRFRAVKMFHFHMPKTSFLSTLKIGDF